MAKIYTKTGDDGTTGTYKGPRLQKDCIVIESYGEIDELNACIGFALGTSKQCFSEEMLYKSFEREKDRFIKSIEAIQFDLFDIGGELAMVEPPEDMQRMCEDRIEFLEGEIDFFESELPKMTHFILPSGVASGAFHIARTVCRRAERTVVGRHRLKEDEHSFVYTCRAILYKYLNRLSDFLFIVTRWLARHCEEDELLWCPS